MLLHGDWSRTLPRAPCTLSRSDQQPADPAMPPVLVFRCVTKDQDDYSVKEGFEDSSFGAEETCLELFEYRSSQPSVVTVTVDVGELGYDRVSCTLFFKCIDDLGKSVGTMELTVSEQLVRLIIIIIIIIIQISYIAR